MSNSALDIINTLGDKFTTLLDNAEGSAEFDGFIDTGSYMLNAIMSGTIFGGMPNNKTVVFAGPQATGKTYFVLSILKNFLMMNPTNLGVLMETEGSTSKKTATSRNLDPKRIILSEPDTVEKFRNTTLKLIDYKMNAKKAPDMMMVLDSLGMLSTEKEMTDSLAGSNTKDMTRAGLIKGSFRTIRLNIGKAKIPMLITNHTYDDVGGNTHEQKMSGGSGPLYASDSIFFLSKAKDTDKDKQTIGAIITIKAFKSRLTREGSKAKVLLNHERGLDKYYGLLDIVQEFELWPYTSNRFETPHGKFFGIEIYRDPERFFTQDVLEKIDECVRKKYEYGSDHVSKDEEDEVTE